MQKVVPHSLTPLSTEMTIVVGQAVAARLFLHFNMRDQLSLHLSQGNTSAPYSEIAKNLPWRSDFCQKFTVSQDGGSILAGREGTIQLSLQSGRLF